MPTEPLAATSMRRRWRHLRALPDRSTVELKREAVGRINCALVGPLELLIFIVYSFQDHLPLNQLNFPGMEAFQAFNTAISFITNTNWQSYSGETTLSNFSQMGGVVGTFFV